MFIRKKKYPSGRIGVIVAEKQNGKMCELFTVGSYSPGESDAQLVLDAQEWISREQGRRHPRLDLFEEERQSLEEEFSEVEHQQSRLQQVLDDARRREGGD